MTDRFQNRRILVTGASSGIGRASALKLAERGAHVLLAARNADALKELVSEIHAKGGTSQAYTVDLSDLSAVDQLCEQILNDHGGVDVLFNNAGRSIRRPLVDSLERFHDFERCMAINYNSPVRLIRNLLPAMLAAGDGHIINSSTWGTLLPTPKFGPYNASKAALDSLADCMHFELRSQGVVTTQIHFPLVHTKMSGATKHYQKLPGMNADQAADWVVRAVSERPERILNRYTKAFETVGFHFPKVMRWLSKQSPLSR